MSTQDEAVDVRALVNNAYDRGYRTAQEEARAWAHRNDELLTTLTKDREGLQELLAEVLDRCFGRDGWPVGAADDVWTRAIARARRPA